MICLTVIDERDRQFQIWLVGVAAAWTSPEDENYVMCAAGRLRVVESPERVSDLMAMQGELDLAQRMRPLAEAIDQMMDRLNVLEARGG